MPSKSTVARARRDLGRGKRPSTAAGEFEEIEHVRRGRHGARSARQAIAISLPKARRVGVPMPLPRKGRLKASTRRSAERDYEVGQEMRQSRRKPGATSARRSRATTGALQREGRAAASRTALAAQAKRTAGARRARRGSVHSATR